MRGREAARRAKGKAIVKSLHLDRLADAGDERARALREADAQLERIAKLLPAALAGGVSIAEVSRVTGVSRPTLYELRARHSEKPLDVALGVLQTVATHGPMSETDIKERVGRSREVSRSMADFERQDFMEHDVEEGPDGPRPVYLLTDKGFQLLENWKLEEVEVEESGA